MGGDDAACATEGPHGEAPTNHDPADRRREGVGHLLPVRLCPPLLDPRVRNCAKVGVRQPEHIAPPDIER